MDEPLSTMDSASDFGSEDTGSTPVGAADLYLILHKVRGEPAFDVATIIGEDDEGEIWIIPTSGHRAYPYQVFEMFKMWYGQGEGSFVPTTVDVPADWPDHYTVRANEGGYGHKEFRKSAVSDLLERIGHGKPKLLRRAVKK